MPAPEPELNDALVTTLLANLGAFQGFARRRLGDDQLAADAVQESLLRALHPVFGLLLSPILAGAAMSLRSVSVIANALRLHFVLPDPHP